GGGVGAGARVAVAAGAAGAFAGGGGAGAASVYGECGGGAGDGGDERAAALARADPAGRGVGVVLCGVELGSRRGRARPHGQVALGLPVATGLTVTLARASAEPLAHATLIRIALEARVAWASRFGLARGDWGDRYARTGKCRATCPCHPHTHRT